MTDERGAKISSAGRAALMVQYSAAIFLTALAVAMHVRFFLSAGGLWRDEVTSVNLAVSGSISHLIANLHHDSFPLLWLLMVRFWEEAGRGDSDLWMRALGLLAGLAVIAVLWRNAKRFGLRTPILGLALLASTSAVICYGDSVRAYGLGMFLGLLAMGLMWEFTRRGTVASFWAALIAAMTSVHVLFFNSVLLLSACAAAATVAAINHRWKRCGLVLAIGLICAGSMLFYLPMIHRTRAYQMFGNRLNAATLINSAQKSVEFSPDANVTGGYNGSLWAIALGSALAVGLAGLFGRGADDQTLRRRDVVLFCCVNLLVGIIGYVVFLKILGYLLNPWHFLAAMALVAGSVDGLFAGVRRPLVTVAVAIFAMAIAMEDFVWVWANAGVRRTNVDLIAAQVQRVSQPGDVVLIVPWDIGCTFHRYYHGPATLLGIPPVPSFDYENFSFLLPFMKDRQAMDPVIRELSQTLRDGHRIWIVGDRYFPPDSPGADHLPDKPDPIFGWRVPLYQASWRNEVFYSLRNEAGEAVWLTTPTDRPISHYETESLSMVQGWRKLASSRPSKE